MRFAALLTFGIAVVSTSPSLVVRAINVPPCYNTCVEVSDLSGCTSITDAICLCNNPTFISETLRCFQKICGPDLQDAITTGETLCLAAGVGTSPASTATPTSGSAPPRNSNLPVKAAAAVHDVNLNICLAAVGLVALAIYWPISLLFWFAFLFSPLCLLCYLYTPHQT